MNEFIPLAFAIESGNTPLPPFIGKLIQHAPESFKDARARQIAVTVRARRAAGAPMNFAIIGEQHMTLAAFIGTDLSPAALPADESEYFAEKCWREYQARKIKSIFSEAHEQASAHPEQAPAIAATARAALDAVSGETANGLPELVDAAGFLAEPIPPPAELVAGILHGGSKLAFGGSSKSFKTWCLLDLAISVATGTEWFGRHTSQGKVLFVNFEIQQHAWQRRIAEVAQAKGVELKSRQMTLWNLRGQAADFHHLIPLIIERCRRENFALMILDPIYKLYGATDENAAGDVAALLNSLERLATETGAAIAFGAHFAKGNASAKDAIDRISGSGVFARDPDSLLIFTKHEADDAFTVEPILRDFAPVAPFVVRWQYPLMYLADDLDPAKLKQPAGRKPKYDLAKLLAIIANNDAGNPISVSEWARLAEMPRKTLAGYLAEMRHKKLIENIREGRTAKQAITNEGKAFINK